LKVAIVNEGIGYPPDAGNWLRTLNLMLPLAKRHQITYVCRGSKDARAAARAREFYGDHGIRALISDDHPPENGGLLFHGRLVANLLSPYPYSIAAHRSPAVRRTIRRLAAEERIDLWQFETISYADTLAGTNARTIVMAHNVESLIWERLRDTESNPARRWYIHHQWRKYARFEGAVLRGADRVVAVSDEDAALMRPRFGIENVAVVDNGVDIARFAPPADAPPRDPKLVLFLGSLEWRPNLDSVELLLSEIMPRVRLAEPEARLCIVGRKPPAALVKRAGADPHTDLHPNVPDVRPYLARAALLAVPLRIGGGSRLKILEAAASGLPVVTTRVGCEGLRFETGRDLAVVEAPDAMADAIVECLRHPHEAADRAASGRRVVDASYDWSTLAERLDRIWVETAGAGGAA
jgi:glycosyltransferase involved in cell wall biosynthesis